MRQIRISMFNRTTRSAGFTFIEIMAAVVILSLGVAGLFRAFLISLNYQQHLTTRLYTLNQLSNEFSQAENKLLTGHALSEADSFVEGYGKGQLRFHLSPIDDTQETLIKGLNYLTVEIQLKQDDKNPVYRRSSFIYVQK